MLLTSTSSMSALIRKVISEKISQVIGKSDVFYELEVPLKKHLNHSKKKAVLQWSHASLNNQDHLKILNNIASLKFDSNLVEYIRVVPDIGGTGAKIEFILHDEPYFNTLLKCETDLEEKRKEHMVFEYSSPNIAKPFHVGHLRSTIIGNVLANIHQSLNYRVTKMNYLGDWGTQLGLLHIGMEIFGATSEQIQSAPIDTMYKAYVLANKRAETDSSIIVRARQLFRELENDHLNSEITAKFNLYRDFTKQELQSVYRRLGVEFDIYDWESQYSEKYIMDVLQKLKNSKLLLNEEDGRKVVEVDQRRIPIIKSDGATLYLTRDIAALLDRWHRFKFTQIFYVVENGQADHLNACFKTSTALCKELEETKLKHVKFGRIHGMSTRKGQAVFLKNLLDEARERVHEKQKQSPNTKIELNECVEDNHIADILGISAVIINDLRQRRQRDYDFNWEKALQMNGDTGIKLQYTHCRLESLLQQQGANITINEIKPNINYLLEPEALDVLHEVSRFPQSLWQSKEQLEACILVNYLFGLCNSTSRALKHLPVKTEPNHLKKLNRLLLFATAKSVLRRGLQILGLKPLNKM